MEPGAECVDSLRTNTIQTNAELEDVVVVLRTGIDLRYTVNDLSKRDSSSVVPYTHLAAFKPDQGHAHSPSCLRV